MTKLKIGLVGCGAIGSYLAKRIDRELRNDARLVAIWDINKVACENLRQSLKQKPAICNSRLVIQKSDIVIEATNVSACVKLLDMLLAKGKDCLIMSVGALLSKVNIIDKARRAGSTIFVPSGAVAGIDAFKAAQLGKIRKVQLVTRKPLKALVGAPYFKNRGINIKSIKKDKEIFNANALQAISAFPQNINVAATLSLATLGPKKTRVKIIACPKLDKNIHEIEVFGDCGKIVTRTENLPSFDNPKTSYLAMLSAFATLKNILNPIKIGT
jgi:aspartate dehydrogenase